MSKALIFFSIAIAIVYTIVLALNIITITDGEVPNVHGEIPNVLIFLAIVTAIVYVIVLALSITGGWQQYESTRFTRFLKKVAKKLDYYCVKFLPSFVLEREKRDPSMFWKEWEENASFWVRNAYGISYFFWILFWILGAITISFVQESIRGGLIFFTTFLFILYPLNEAIDWRGKFKRHVLNSRFERDVDMATKSTSDVLRGSEVLALKQIFATWSQGYIIGGIRYRSEKLSDLSIYMNRVSSDFSYDDLIKANKIILKHLIFNNFRMTERDLRNTCRELYTKSRMSYGKGCDKENEYVKSLYGMTHESDVNEDALRFWESIVASNRKEAGNSLIEGGIYGDKVMPDESSFFIFFEMNLRNIKFLVKLDSGEIDFPTPEARANFRKNCFIGVKMYKSTLDHVDFSKAHLDAINCRDYDMPHGGSGMSCIGTIFDEANLIHCEFKDTDFKDASFIGTNITGSNFCEAKNLTPEQLKTAYWIRPDDLQFLETAKPKFPEGESDGFPPGFADTLPNRPTSPT